MPLSHLVMSLVVRVRRVVPRLPIIIAVGERTDDPLASVLGQLKRWLEHAGPRQVPHAWVDADNFRGATGMQDLLEKLYELLSRPAFGGTRIRFERFELILWLIDQDLGAVRPVGSRPTELGKLLRDRDRHLPRADNADTGANNWFAVAYNALTRLARRAAPAVFRARVNGHLPGFGRRYRWFMEQPYLSPNRFGRFLDFGVQLTRGVVNPEDPEVQRLLLHVFLEDVRRAYARGPWRISGVRRTAYPIALVDNVAVDNAGSQLLSLVDQVRATHSNPLLLVAGGGGGVPPELANVITDVRVVASGESQSKPPMAPWPARRRTIVFAMVSMVCLALVAAAGWWDLKSGGSRSNVSPSATPSLSDGRCPTSDQSGRHTKLEAVEGPVGCIGYSDGEDGRIPFESGDPELPGIVEKVFDQNRAVDRRAARAVYTIVYFGQLSGVPRTKESGYASDIEELDGLLLAQTAGLDAPGTNPRPLMRIVIANAGYQMRYAPDTAKMVAQLSRMDSSVIAAVGLVESRENTGTALGILQQAGLLALAPTLSADNMKDKSKFYLQIAPQNSDESTLIASYLRDETQRRKQNDSPPLRSVHVYYTTGGTPLDQDWYVHTLIDDLQIDLPHALSPGVYDAQVDLWPADTRTLCNKDAVVFAGRWSEFKEFIDAVAGCQRRPMIIADDSVNRYMASDAYRSDSPGLPLLYISKSQLASCDALQRDSSGNRAQFKQQVTDALGACKPDNKPVGERVGLAYDAAMLLADAVTSLLGRMANADGQPRHDLGPINSLAVHAEILALHPVADPYNGITGPIGFADGGTPSKKRVSLVQVERMDKSASTPVGRATEIYRCGKALGQPDGCTYA